MLLCHSEDHMLKAILFDLDGTLYPFHMDVIDSLVTATYFSVI